MHFPLVYIELNMIMIRFKLSLCLQEFEVNDNTYQIYINKYASTIQKIYTDNISGI